MQVRNSSNTVLATLHTYSNLDKGSSYVQRTFDLSAYKGQTVQLYFNGTEDAQDATLVPWLHRREHQDPVT